MVYITGDLHGDYTRFSSPAMRRIKKGDTLIVCGDFGFIWDGGRRELKRLHQIGRLPYTVLFVDGPHENFDLLNRYDTVEWNGGRAQIIDGSLIHLLRGEIYTIEGETYFTFGGGESPEHAMRLPGKSWWPEEMPSEEEMHHGLDTLAANDNRVDYLITHQPSARATGFLAGQGGHLDGVNLYLNQFEDTVTFRRWYFGSLHMDKPMSRRHIAVFQKVLPVREESKKARHAK